MNLSLSEEQEMLKGAARDFLAEKCPKTAVKEMEESEEGYSPQLWREMAELGWMGLVFPEKYGGAEMSFLDLTVLLEEMGRSALPGPYFSTVVLGGLTILDIGSNEQKEEYLPAIASGQSLFTLALTESDARYEPSSIKMKATPSGDGFILNGTKLFVPDAHIADYIICAARTSEQAKPEEGITLFLVDAKSPGIKSTVLKSIASDKLAEVVFDEVRVPKENMLGDLDQGWPAIERIIRRAAVAKAAETVGGIQQVLEMTVDYAKDRKQFGRPIGSFQIIQHYLADMATDVDSSRFVTYQAAWRLNQGLECSKEIAVAKSWTGEASQRVVALAHQIHGAIGVTMDHDLHFYTRRARAAQVTFGDADFHRETVAQEMGL